MEIPRADNEPEHHKSDPRIETMLRIFFAHVRTCVDSFQGTEEDWTDRLEPAFLEVIAKHCMMEGNFVPRAELALRQAIAKVLERKDDDLEISVVSAEALDLRDAVKGPLGGGKHKKQSGVKHAKSRRNSAPPKLTRGK